MLGEIDAFRCALRQWEMGDVETGGTVSSRHHLLDIRVDTLSFVSAISDALMSEPCDGPNINIL